MVSMKGEGEGLVRMMDERDKEERERRNSEQSVLFFTRGSY